MTIHNLVDFHCLNLRVSSIETSIQWAGEILHDPPHVGVLAAEHGLFRTLLARGGGSESDQKKAPKEPFQGLWALMINRVQLTSFSELVLLLRI